jgi:hypothetical protein
MATRAASRIPTLALLTVVLLAVAACRPTTTEQRTIGSFDSLGASNGVTVTVHVVAGSSPSLSVIAPDNVVPRVVTRVEGTRLNVSVDGNQSGSVKVEVTTATLTAVDVSSQASVVVDGLSGATFAVNASSQTSVEASGTTAALTLNVSSQSKAMLGGLTATSAQVNLSSQSEAEVRATDSVSGTVSSQSKLTVFGSPPTVNVETSSQSTVVQR